MQDDLILLDRLGWDTSWAGPDPREKGRADAPAPLSAQVVPAQGGRLKDKPTHHPSAHDSSFPAPTYPGH
jgi:hypothetical protein